MPAGYRGPRPSSARPPGRGIRGPPHARPAGPSRTLPNRDTHHDNGPRMARKAEEQIVMALAAGASKESAAKIAGVSSRTVFRRCQDAEFRARVDRARAELVEGAVGRLSAIGPLAADELHRLIKDGT